VPMMTNLEGSLSSNKIFLVSLAGLNCSTGDWRVGLPDLAPWRFLGRQPADSAALGIP
jgi:hypothetical protein